MSNAQPIPATPRVISPSPTPSETSEQTEGYFTRSAARRSRTKSPQPDTIREEKNKDDSEGSDSSLDKRARTRSRSPILAQADGVLVNGTTKPPRRMSGLTSRTSTGVIKKSEPLPTKHTVGLTNGNALPPQVNGHLSPYSQIKKSWREFSRSPSPLGLIPLHRHYRYLIHKHEIPRKALHVSIGFLTLQLYRAGFQTGAITPWLIGLFIPIASVDLLRHRYPTVNRFYVKCLGALMRETEVDGYNGVIWYLLGAYVALRFYPNDVGVMSILLLSWCDTAASTFGRLYGRYTIRLRRGKSLAGSLAAMCTGILAAWFFWGWLAPRTGPFPDDPVGGFMFKGVLSLPEKARELLGWSKEASTITGTTAMAVMSITTGLIASFSEFVDIFSWDDNLTIPLISSAGLWLFLKAFGS
ncbi:Diacylglycerol kinase [Exophiala xenobiotica]|uniref:Diacylglycerol kinase n=1 Tax=Lithohypha guttulata TaxID=1690604 RepID=A0ABR0K464_9EURO|nr:Diacylglycerol kinase [Lithohypha guttulata]KAK5312966.1 Diacylglycerol kinase [Exophiala xenobiotica]